VVNGVFIQDATSILFLITAFGYGQFIDQSFIFDKLIMWPCSDTLNN
jgi:hypothetical protein